jgi:hypothetical protein
MGRTAICGRAHSPLGHEPFTYTVGVEASRGPHFSFSGMVSQTQAEALIDPGFMLGISVG